MNGSVLNLAAGLELRRDRIAALILGDARVLVDVEERIVVEFAQSGFGQDPFCHGTIGSRSFGLWGTERLRAFACPHTRNRKT